MYTVKDLAQRFETTERAVRLRLKLLEPALVGHTGKIGKNVRTYDDHVVDLLERLEDIHREEGLTLEDAARKVLAANGNGAKPTPQVPSVQSATLEALRDELTELLRERIEELKEERDYWRRRAEYWEARFLTLLAHRHSPSLWDRLLALFRHRNNGHKNSTKRDQSAPEIARPQISTEDADRTVGTGIPGNGAKR